MSTKTQLVTADELLRMPRGRFRYELVEGELKTTSPAGSEHGAIIVRITVRLGSYVEANDLGVCFGAETGFKLASDPDTVRAPDVAFIGRDRIPADGIPNKYWPGAPELAVEVLSPGDAPVKVEEKVAAWMSAGARAVWVVNPKTRTVTVHRAEGEVVTLGEQDELDGGAVVPGFRCKVSEIFV
jgi:Uma2 family endonuclease